MATGSGIEVISCFPDPMHLSSFAFFSEDIPWVELVTRGKIFLSETLNSAPLEAVDSVSTGTVGLSTSSLTAGNLRNSAAFACKENGIVLPAKPTSFLDSAATSVLGTITGTTSDLLKVGTLAVEWALAEFLFMAVVLGTAVELGGIVFGLELKLIL